MTATFDPVTRTLIVRLADGSIETFTDVDLKVIYPIIAGGLP